MSSPPDQRIGGFNLASARRAILRYQPASNWVSESREPTPRMTIGLGFDVSRPEGSELMTEVGLDPVAVRAGRMPISDAQMNKLFDLTLLGAVRLAQRHIPAFEDMQPEQQWAVLELIVWLGPGATEAAFRQLEELSTPLTPGPLEPSPWFDSGTVGPVSRQAPARSHPSSSEPALRAPACQTTFESFGLVTQLVSDDPGLLKAAQVTLPPGWRPIDGEPSVRFGVWTDGVITVDGARVDRAADRTGSFVKLSAIVRHHLATHAPGFTFVHAGVVDAGGCGMVIPGRSYTGKSTLVAELVRLGARYVSDEYAVIDSRGLVHPFAKPLSIRTARGNPLGGLVPVPEEVVADRPLQAGLIVLTSYAPGARWRPSVCSRAEGAFALLQNTVSARLRPGSALTATSQLARTATFLVGRRGEASDAAQALLETALRQCESSNMFAS